MNFDNEIVKLYKIKFDISIWKKEKLVWLNNFIIPKNLQHMHIGTKIMEQFCQWLDINQYDSKLLVSNCYGTPEDILIAFYQKFGYIIEKSKTKNLYMIRRYVNANRKFV